MGSATSNFFPTSVVDCNSAGVASAGTDARYDYECTTDSQVLSSLTVIHLLVLVSILLLGLLVFLVYQRICARRFYIGIRAMPLRMLPIGRDTVSRAMHTRIMAGLVESMGRDAPPMKPPLRADPSAAMSHARAADIRNRILELSHDIGPALRCAFASEMHLLERGLSGLAPVLEERYRVPASSVFLIAEVVEAAHLAQQAEADGTGDDESDDERFSESEYAIVEQAVWSLIDRLSAAGSVSASSPARGRKLPAAASAAAVASR